MILNNYMHEQLAAAHRRDRVETAERHRLATQVGAHVRDRFPSPAIQRDAHRPRAIASALCACAARTATR